MQQNGARAAPRAAKGLTVSVTASVVAFVLLAWLPLLLALGAAEEPGGWHEEAGIALGLVGLSLLLLQFAHSGRWHLVSGRNGIDVTMRFHRAAAILVLVMVLLHPCYSSCRCCWSIPCAALASCTRCSRALA